MDSLYIFIGLAFIVSSAGIPTYSYITRKQYIRLRTQFITQGSFWVVLSAVSIRSLTLSVNDTAFIINAVFVFIGLLFMFFAITMIVKDRGGYIYPYAKMNNQEAFKAYIEQLGVEKVTIRTTNGKQYDIIEFTDTANEEQKTILDEIANNTDIVNPHSSKEATSRLLKSYTFGLIMILIAHML